MTTLINKITTAISGAVLFAAAMVMTGLGLAVVATLAAFAFLAVGVALLAAPFAGMRREDDVIDGEAQPAA